jgi:hypothetical protein
MSQKDGHERSMFPTWMVRLGQVTVIVLVGLAALPPRAAITLQSAYMGSIAMALWTFWIVRFINRRDDPQHAKRPPDPP